MKQTRNHKNKMMSRTIPNDYQELRKIAKAEGIRATKKADIQEELKSRGWLDDIWDMVKDETRELFEQFKDWFRGGLWIHIYLDDNDQVRIKITHGKQGPAVTAHDLTEKEAAKVLADLPKGLVNELHAERLIKKRTRVKHAVTAAQRLHA